MREQTVLAHTYSYIGRLWNGVSGNYDTSRSPLDRIVIHSMAGSMAGTLAHFQNPATIPSAHYGIGFDGKIVQYLPENVTAYHAGNYAINQRSFGVEHEDQGNNQIDRPDALYESSAQLVADLSKIYNIPLDRTHVIKHNEVIATECPGSLDIDRIIARAIQINAAPAQPAAEQPHNYSILPSVFNTMVTKSTNYDTLWADLKLDPTLKANADSQTIIEDYIQAQISQARNIAPTTPVTPPAAAPVIPGTPAVPAQPTQPVQQTAPTQPIAPSNAGVSFWNKGINEVINDIYNALKGDRAN